MDTSGRVLDGAARLEDSGLQSGDALIWQMRSVLVAQWRPLRFCWLRVSL